MAETKAAELEPEPAGRRRDDEMPMEWLVGRTKGWKGFVIAMEA